MPPLTIGWKEFLDLPELGIRRLKAKVDTGARTSSLHVDEIRYLARHPDGSADLELLIPLGKRGRRTVTARARMIRRTPVTDSGGHREIRPVIDTVLVLGPVRKRISLTLTDRGGMRFRMLLGRKALEGDFLVDVSRCLLLAAWQPGRAAQGPPGSGRPA